MTFTNEMSMLKDHATPTVTQREIGIRAASHVLPGQLSIPEAPRGLVLFIHGSGSSRHSPRNQQVAAAFGAAGLATLLFDLFTPREESFDLQTAELRFNIPFLAKRVIEATDWLRDQQQLASLPIGYFSTDTATAAALTVATERPELVQAIVSRGGQPDLAGDSLSLVTAPTLLIVGSNDPEAVTRNEQAVVQMRCEREMRIIPGATHLFEEPGALERVTLLARGWFKRYLGTQATPCR